MLYVILLMHMIMDSYLSIQSVIMDHEVLVTPYSVSGLGKMHTRWNESEWINYKQQFVT